MATLADPQPFFSCFTKGTSSHAPVATAADKTPHRHMIRTITLINLQNMRFALKGLNYAEGVRKFELGAASTLGPEFPNNTKLAKLQLANDFA